MPCSIVSSIIVTMFYVRSLELTHLSVGMDRISANIWSSHSQAGGTQVYCLLVMNIDGFSFLKKNANDFYFIVKFFLSGHVVL